LSLDSFIVAGAGAIVGTTLMTLFELPFYRRMGLTGIFEFHENQVLISRIRRRPVPTSTDFLGVLSLHYLNGFLAGLFFPIFALILSALTPHPPFPWAGVLYAVLLWILTLVPIHEPITGFSPFSHPLGRAPLIISLAGHVIYGITLAIFLFSL